MRRLITILFLFGVAYGQVYPIPIVHENRNYHFVRKVYIDQKLKIGDPLDPVINRKLHVVADTIRFEGLDGTGTFLTIDANGDILKGTVGAAGVTGLNNQQVLYGKSDGTIDQEAAFFYDESSDLLGITSTVGGLYVDGGSGNISLASYNAYTIQNGSSMGGYYYNRFEFYNGTWQQTINRPTSPTESYQLYLPNAQGAANTYLKNDGSGNLSWATIAGGGTVTSIATTSPITGGTITTTGTIGINNAAADGSTKGAASFTANDFDATSGNISIDYTNGQAASGSNKGFLTSADWTTFNNKVSFDITSKTAETSLANNDEIPVYDLSETAINKATVETLLSSDNPTAYRNYRFSYFNEFLNLISTATGGADIVATNSGTSAATNNQATDATNRVGLVRSTTGTTATGRTSPSTSSTAVRFGGGVWVYETEINIATLSTSLERYQLVIGFFDVQTAANQTDGAYFLYDEGGVSTGSAASANWQTVTCSNSARTFNTTSTAVANGSWVNLRIEINAAASSVTYYINGVATATSHTANIPTGSGRETGFGWLLIKSVGTTARTVDFDYIYSNCDFTSSR